MKKFAVFLWNEVITHIPMRRFRRVILKKLLGICLQDNSCLMMHVKLYSLGRISLGSNSVVNQFCVLDGRDYHIRIGDNADIGPYTHIWTIGHDPDSPVHKTSGGDVEINDHAWIASRVTILPGVTIGRGAVVAAGSIVTKDVPEKAIVAGNPAKFVRWRKNELEYFIDFAPPLR